MNVLKVVGYGDDGQPIYDWVEDDSGYDLTPPTTINEPVDPDPGVITYPDGTLSGGNATGAAGAGAGEGAGDGEGAAIISGRVL